jgi:hypothetical protein
MLLSELRGDEPGSLTTIATHEQQHVLRILGEEQSAVDLKRDRFADENGQVVHEACYMIRVMAAQPPAPRHTE